MQVTCAAQHYSWSEILHPEWWWYTIISLRVIFLTRLLGLHDSNLAWGKLVVSPAFVLWSPRLAVECQLPWDQFNRPQDPLIRKLIYWGHFPWCLSPIILVINLISFHPCRILACDEDQMAQLYDFCTPFCIAAIRLWSSATLHSIFLHCVNSLPNSPLFWFALLHTKCSWLIPCSLTQHPIHCQAIACSKVIYKRDEENVVYIDYQRKKSTFNNPLSLSHSFPGAFSILLLVVHKIQSHAMSMSRQMSFLGTF